MFFLKNLLYLIKVLYKVRLLPSRLLYFCFKPITCYQTDTVKKRDRIGFGSKSVTSPVRSGTMKVFKKDTASLQVISKRCENQKFSYEYFIQKYQKNIKTLTCHAHQTGKNEDLIQDQTFV